jgi:hypothetical protein
MATPLALGGAWTNPVIEMYLVAMEQLAREDITAAAAAHRELGRDYDGAVAEGLIERIGDEIDKRVDARLGRRGDDYPGQRGDHPARRGKGSTSGPGVAGIFLALGSMGIGLGAAAAVLAENRGGTGLVALIWIVIAVINVAYARRR